MVPHPVPLPLGVSITVGVADHPADHRVEPEAGGDQARPGHVRPDERRLGRHRRLRLRQRAQPRGGRSGEACREQRMEFRHELPVAARATDHEEAADSTDLLRTGGLRIGDLALEAADRGTDVIEVVPDLDDRALASRGAAEPDVDRPREQPAPIAVERRLRDGRPATLTCKVDDEPLALEVLVVPRAVGPRDRLQEGNELDAGRGRGGCPRLERGRPAMAALHPADPRLCDPGTLRDVGLTQPAGPPRLAEHRAEPAGDLLDPSPGALPIDARPASSIRHPILPRREGRGPVDRGSPRRIARTPYA
jgi:hypothetical protein